MGFLVGSVCDGEVSDDCFRGEPAEVAGDPYGAAFRGPDACRW